MTAPERNLPPDAQAWGRYIEKRIAELSKAAGLASTTARAATARTGGAARAAAEASERAAQLEQSQTDLVQEVNNKDVSSWVPAEPENPKHNDHWYDVADGNVLKIRADYGAYERVNHVLNPTFRLDTQGWTALGGELATTPEGRGHISAPTDGAAAIVETEGRAVVIDLPASDGWDEGDDPRVNLNHDGLATPLQVRVFGTSRILAPGGPMYAVPVSPGAEYAITFDRTPSAEVGHGFLVGEPVAGASVRSHNTTTDQTVSVTVPNDTPWLIIDVTGDPTLRVLVEEGAVSGGPYFDGDTPGAYWTGTPGESTSVFGDQSDDGVGPAGQVGALWTASAELELVESSLYVTATLEVIDSNDVPVATSGPVRLEYGAPTRITARPQEGIEGTMDSVRVALSLVNEEEPNFEVTVDEVILEAADYGDDEEQQFFDGSMPGILWQGTPHLSTSWWDGEPRWIEAQDEKLKNEVFQTTDEIRDDLDQAAADLAAAQEWIDETGYELGDRLGATEAGLDAAGSLLEAVRAQVGRKQWVPLPPFEVEPYTGGGGPFLRVEPLGQGRVRFTALRPGPVHGWQVGAEIDLGDGDTYVHTFTSTGTPYVRYWAPGASGDFLWQGPVSITAEMLGEGGEWVDIDWPEVDWSQAEIALSQLRDAGVLDPDVLAALYEDVVVAGISIATEAFIGGNAILEDSVQARHIIASESLWAKVAAFGKVTTNMLYVGGSNLIPDPNFEDADLTEGRRSRSAATLDSNGLSATGYFYYLPGTTLGDVQRYAIPVQPGETYRIEIPVTLPSLLSTTARVEVFAANGARSLQTATFADVDYENGVLAYDYTIPAGRVYMSPLVYRTSSFTVHPGVTVRQKVESNLIVKGGVTAEHLNVVTETPGGAGMSILPDGIRMWGSTGDGDNVNVILTPETGFQMYNAEGEEVLSADSTGNLSLGGNASLKGNLEVEGTITARGDNFEVTVDDTGVRLIAKVTPTLQGSFTAWGHDGAASSLSVLANQVYVGEGQREAGGGAYTGSRVGVYNPSTGALIRSIAAPAGFRVSRARVGSSRVHMFITDNTTPSTKRIRITSLTGTLQRTVNLPSGADPYSFSVDPSGNQFFVHTTSEAPTWSLALGRVASGSTSYTSYPIISYGETFSPIFSAASSDTVFVGFGKRLDAYTHTGQHKWTRTMPHYIGDLSVQEGLLLVGHTDGSATQVYGYDTESMAARIAWAFPYGFGDGNLAYSGGDLFTLEGFTGSPNSPLTVRRYSVEENPQPRAALDTVTGRLTAIGADLSGDTSIERVHANTVSGQGFAPVTFGPALAPQGINSFASEGDRDLALPSPALGTEAITGVNTNSLVVWRWTGVEWVPVWRASSGTPYAQAAGTVEVIGTGIPNAATTVNLSGMGFTKAPAVVATAEHSAYFAYVSSPSSNSVGIGLRHWSGTNWTSTQTVHWHAIQMTP